MEHALTYVIKFYRNKDLLDVEIHRTLPDVASAAMGYVSCFSTNLQAANVEQLLIAWEPDEHRFDWDDGEYSIVIEEYVAKHAPADDNECQVITLGERRRYGRLQETSG